MNSNNQVVAFATPLTSTSPNSNIAASRSSPASVEEQMATLKLVPGSPIDPPQHCADVSQNAGNVSQGTSGSVGSDSTEDSVSIRCQFLLTPNPSPPNSPRRHGSADPAASDIEEGEISSSGSPSKGTYGNETVDISAISLRSPEPRKFPPTSNFNNFSRTSSATTEQSINGTGLNANACNFVPSSAVTALSQPQYSPPDGTIDLANTSTTQSDSDYDPATGKTPNVYINGLPAHYPEEQLYQLAAPFGGVRSVRTFTRHIGDRESGYGFVLFDSVDGADRCINALRKYRNLHPTFSKQIHKIPGTQYGSSVSMPVSLSSLDPTSATSQDGWGPESDDSCGQSESFKDRMERLADPTSTNLYLEGLPLSIDEPTLSALVSPHHIKSSRFFQTRLSNPPRIIAFVRLDTRVGAEDVIERLHGRMVRGWNDTGSRISVRFADTSEQRELRRTERAMQDDDPSPAKLTIAQAALLNMCGQDQRIIPTSQSSGAIGHQSLPPVIGTQNEAPLNIHPLIPEHRHSIAAESNGAVPPSPSCNDLDFASNRIDLGNYRFQGNKDLNQDVVNPQMAAILDSLRHSAASVPFHPAQPSNIGKWNQSSQDKYPLGDVDLNSTNLFSSANRNTTQARNGFTPTEAYIIQAHTAQQRKTGGGAPKPSCGNPGSEMYRGGTGGNWIGNSKRPRTQVQTSPASGFYGTEGTPGGLSLEAEFHAKHDRKQPSMDFGFSSNAAGLNQEEPNLKRSQFQQYIPTTQCPPTSRMDTSQTHVRSTTMPHPSSQTASAVLQGKRSSISMQPPRNIDGLGSGGFCSQENNSFCSTNKQFSYHNERHDKDGHQPNRTQKLHQDNEYQRQQNNMARMSIETRKHNNYNEHDPNTQDLSPTLTYSSRTPTTSSPSTPHFFAGFTGNGENVYGGEGCNEKVDMGMKLKSGMERKRRM